MRCLLLLFQIFLAVRNGLLGSLLGCFLDSPHHSPSLRDRPNQFSLYRAYQLLFMLMHHLDFNSPRAQHEEVSCN